LPDQQRTRVQQRDGSGNAVIESIMQSQIGRDERLQQADDILSNSASITDFYEKIDDLNFKYAKFSDA
jgi:dephospho-CoA kinase